MSNLRDGAVYTLADSTNLIAGSGNVTRLIRIDGDTGLLTTNYLELSSAIPIGYDTGIFAGYDAVVLNTGGRVYRIELPSGTVIDLGPMAPYAHSSCENWAYWGVSEFFLGSVYLDYVRDSQTIVRTRVPDGVTTNLATFSNLSDMCSFTVSVPLRWYFHYQGTAQFGGVNETLGYAVAAVDRPPRIPTVLTNRVINEDSNTGAINVLVQDETPLAQLIVSASSSNPTLVPSTNIVVGGTSARTLTVIPARDEFGTTVITLTVIDGIGQSTKRSFTLTVNPVNDRPSFTKGGDVVALEDSGQHSLLNWATRIAAGPPNESDQTVTFIVTNNNPSLFASQPVISSDGTLVFTPSPDSNGLALVTVRLQDDGGTNNGGRNISLAQTFNITVAPVNDPPSFIKGPDVTVLEDSGPQVVPQWATSLRAGPLDESTQTLAFIVRSISNPGLFAAQPAITADGTLTFTPSPNSNGAASVSIVLQDNGGTANGGMDASDPQTFLITVQPVNDPPIANPQSLTVAEDTPLGITLTGFDIDGDPLTFSIVSPPSHGTLTGSGANRIYQPATNFFGADSFTFKINDGQVDSAEATASINVTPVNDAPIADSQSFSGPEDTPLAITLTGSDVEGDSLAYSVVTSPSHGTLTGSGANRIYQPATNFFGTDSFTFKINDGQADSTPGTISLTITPVNDAPVANSQSVTSYVGRPLTITLTGSDVEGDLLTFKVMTSPAHGPLTGSGATRFYQAVTNFSGVDSFTFVANDGQLDSVPATVSISVVANHPPIAVILAPSLVLLTPGSKNGIAISPNNTNALVVLDGRQSHDTDNDPLTFAWLERAATGPFASSALASNLFKIGNHTIKLVVNDGKDSGAAELNFDVTTSEDAVLQVIRFLSRSSIARKNRHDLLNSLESAAESFEEGHFRAGVRRLQTFQNKVRAQIARQDPALADALIQAVQKIIDSQTVLPRLLAICGPPHGHLRFILFGEASCRYTIETSTNLLDWTPLTSCISLGGTNEFTDPATAKFNQRFYRAVLQQEDE